MPATRPCRPPGHAGCGSAGPPWSPGPPGGGHPAAAGDYGSWGQRPGSSEKRLP
jgi:hypothetical protein